jgi:hypothetical protein
MSFLTNTPDLTGWRYGEDAVTEARKYLAAAFEREMPGWLQKPRGGLSVQWQSDGPYPACYLTWVAACLSRLEHAATRKSGAAVREKIVSLLRATGAQFEETLAEIVVGATLSERFSPIALEPLVPENTASHKRPPSPDFAIRVPGGDVCIEVTVFRTELLDRWDREANWLSAEVSRRARKSGLSVSVDFELPLRFRRIDINDSDLSSLINTIGSAPRGQGALPASTGAISFTWQPVPVFDQSGRVLGTVEHPAPLPAGVAHALAISWRPLITEDLSEPLLRSLRNTLDAKRDQRTFDGPYVVAIGLGHHRIWRDGVKAVFAQRIWPNTQYAAISAVIHYTPPVGFGASDVMHSIILQVNPNARYPIPAAVVEAFEGTAQFHLP